jgi:hypothetical protein
VHTVAIDYGTDLSLGESLDISPEFPEVTGIDVVIDAVVRRLATTRGDLFYDAEYGYNLMDLLSDSYTPAQLGQIGVDIRLQLELDEMISSAQANVSLSTASVMHVDVSIHTAAGPFKMTLEVTIVTVQILNAARA